MPQTRTILTSIHGRRAGLDAQNNLVVNGRVAATTNDTGALKRVTTAPVAVNATATLTSLEILSGIITSTTGAAVSATLPTGTLLDAVGETNVNEGFDWVVINTGGANAFTIVASTGHTIVGSAAVASSTSGRFRTRKTAANTFVTYRV